MRARLWRLSAAAAPMPPPSPIHPSWPGRVRSVGIDRRRFILIEKKEMICYLLLRSEKIGVPVGAVLGFFLAGWESDDMYGRIGSALFLTLQQMYTHTFLAAVSDTSPPLPPPPPHTLLRVPDDPVASLSTRHAHTRHWSVIHV